MPGPVEVDTIVAGRYTLERRISQGGIGSLWLARDEQTGETCVLRLADGTGHNFDILELAARYRTEYELIERIRCENVVDIMDYGDWRGMPYLVAEYLQCEDLASHLRRERQLRPALAYRLLAHTARALDRAHAAGIVHGDVTPENILVVTDGNESVAKLHNFGLTQRSFEQILGKVTKIGIFVRLPHYASPEQMANAPLDHRSDVWSLAVIAYECLTGTRPFEGDVYGDLVAKILCAPNPPLIVPGCPNQNALQAWWERACAREPARRFQSAKELSDALGSALGLALVPFSSELTAGGASTETGKPVSAEPPQASVRKQSFASIPRRMTPLGIGVVNPILISATPIPAWSTKEASSELRALEAQRLASMQPELDIPKAPRLPSLQVTPIVDASEAPEVRPATTSVGFAESEAPTLARGEPAAITEFLETEAPTIARSREQLAPAAPNEGVPRAPFAFAILQPLRQRRGLLITFCVLFALATLLMARSFGHNGHRGSVQPETSATDDSRSKPVAKSDPAAPAPPSVPDSAEATAASNASRRVGTLSAPMGTSANTADSHLDLRPKASTRADRRSTQEARSADKPVAEPRTRAPAQATEGKPVPGSPAVFDSDTPPNVVQPRSSKPQMQQPTRDYGI